MVAAVTGGSSVAKAARAPITDNCGSVARPFRCLRDRLGQEPHTAKEEAFFRPSAASVQVFVLPLYTMASGMLC